MLQVKQIIRKFKYNDIFLDDVSSSFTVEEIKAHYSNLYPELTTAQIQNKGIQSDNTQLYEFNLVVGTKG